MAAAEWVKLAIAALDVVAALAARAARKSDVARTAAERRADALQELLDAGDAATVAKVLAETAKPAQTRAKQAKPRTSGKKKVQP